jgi:hypothetical protein
MEQHGSQLREKLEDTEYALVEFSNAEHGPDGELTWNEAVLQDSDGKREVWVLHDDHAGYTVEINGLGYEFISSYWPDF